MKEVTKKSKAKGIKLEKSEKEKSIGWCGQLKGLLQVLWERGWIDMTNLSSYTETGDSKKSNPCMEVIHDEPKKISLRIIMNDCKDFKIEPTSMESLLTIYPNNHKMYI